MYPFSIAQQGVLLEGHAILRAAARAAAAEYLVAVHGWTEVAADDATADAAISRAWWAADLVDDQGRAGVFVGEDHPQAAAVTVVNIPNSP